MKKVKLTVLGNLISICAILISQFAYGLGQVAARSSVDESAPQALQAGKYDDSDEAWAYDGLWNVSNSAHGYKGQAHVSYQVGDSADLLIYGTGFSLIYTRSTGKGKLDVFVDDAWMATLNQSGSKLLFKEEWASPELAAGEHHLRFVHLSGGSVDIDGIRVSANGDLAAPAPQDEQSGQTGSTASPTPYGMTATPSPEATSGKAAVTQSPKKTPVGYFTPVGVGKSAGATNTPTATNLPAATATSLPQTATRTAAPTSTGAPASPTATSIPPTATRTAVPTSTSLPAATATSLPPTATRTAAPTATNIPPTATATTVPGGGHNYYVSPTGNDANSGASDAEAWLTLNKVNATSFQPGDVVHFKRNGSWSGGLVIDTSGTQGMPVRFTAYGSGARPVFSNPGSPTNYTNAIMVTASWVIVESLEATNAQYVGVYISNTAANNIIRDIEATNVGAGIQIRGQHNLVTQNTIHDLHMVKNTPGGTDDSGAMGISFIDGSYNEVSYNRMVNCIASSYDFGVDGGVVEFFGNSNGNYVHHNWGSDSAGFSEVGGGTSNDNILAYNVSVNNDGFTSVHLNDGFASVVSNFRVENNTIVETTQTGWVPFGFIGDPTAGTFLLRNNIIYIDKFTKISNKSTFTHTNNVYFLAGGTQLGYTLSTGEVIGDPQFTNLAGRDFHLKTGSTAINRGINLSYSLDFDNLQVPAGGLPDAGSYEFESIP